MEYFFYCRDNPDTRALRWQLAEAHWTFMDNYAEGMIARGPTLAEDGISPTGSLHIVDLPDARAARVFAFEEPNYKAGVFGDVMVRRWHNDLGRKMWAFKPDPGGNQRFLAIGHGKPGVQAISGEMREARRAFIAPNDEQGRLILSGPLLSDDAADWLGEALAVELPTYRDAETMMADDPYSKAGLYTHVEIHRWRFGGRPDGVYVR